MCNFFQKNQKESRLIRACVVGALYLEDERIMADILQWVSDQLHEILGLSDRSTAEFIVSKAKKCTSEEHFLNELKETGAIKINNSVVSFVSELWGKVPHKKKVDTYKASRDKEREAILQQQKNKSYKLLSDDDEDDTGANSHHGRRKSSSKRVRINDKESRKRRNIRKEKTAAWESESEEEPQDQMEKGQSDSDEWER